MADNSTKPLVRFFFLQSALESPLRSENQQMHANHCPIVYLLKAKRKNSHSYMKVKEVPQVKRSKLHLKVTNYKDNYFA